LQGKVFNYVSRESVKKYQQSSPTEKVDVAS